MLACKHLDRILRASGSPSVWPHSYNACRKLLLHKQWEISFQFWKKNDFYNLTLLIQFLKYEWTCSSKKTSNLTLWIFRVFTYWEINFPCVENLLPECCQDQVHIDRRTWICIHSAKYKKNSGHLFLATLMQCLDHTNLPLIRRGTTTFYLKKLP